VNTSAEWRVDIESKTVTAEEPGMTIDVTAYWDIKMRDLAIPVIVKTVSGGAFWSPPLPIDTLNGSVVGVEWNWSNPGWAALVQQVRGGQLGCNPEGDTGYDGVSPDHFVINAAGSGLSDTPPEPTGRDVVTLTFDVNGNVGVFEFDTACYLGSLDRIFMIDNENFQDHGPGGTGECTFNKGLVAILGSEMSDPDDRDSVIIDLAGAERFGDDSILVPIIASNDQELEGLGIPIYYKSPGQYWRTDVDSSRFFSERWTGTPEVAYLAHFYDADTAKFLIYAHAGSGDIRVWSDTIAMIHFFKNPDFQGSGPEGFFEMWVAEAGPFSGPTFIDAQGSYWAPLPLMTDGAGGYKAGPDSVRTDVVDITSDETGTPEAYALFQNYPNPFNAATQIEFALRQDGHVKLEIFNILGQKIATLVDEYLTAGLKRTSWDGRDAGGRTVASGMYFYRLATGDFVEMKKMVLMK